MPGQVDGKRTMVTHSIARALLVMKESIAKPNAIRLGFINTVAAVS